MYVSKNFYIAIASYLEESGEDVELEVGDEVVAGEVDGGLEGHGLQSRPDGMHLRERLPEVLPRHYRPEMRTSFPHHMKTFSLIIPYING